MVEQLSESGLAQTRCWVERHTDTQWKCPEQADLWQILGGLVATIDKDRAQRRLADEVEVEILEAANKISTEAFLKMQAHLDIREKQLREAVRELDGGRGDFYEARMAKYDAAVREVVDGRD